jgi:hypothetical protein
MEFIIYSYSNTNIFYQMLTFLSYIVITHELEKKKTMGKYLCVCAHYSQCNLGF